MTTGYPADETTERSCGHRPRARFILRLRLTRVPPDPRGGACPWRFPAAKLILLEKERSSIIKFLTPTITCGPDPWGSRPESSCNIPSRPPFSIPRCAYPLASEPRGAGPLPSASLATGRRPLCRAGRPSRDLGFFLVSPLELWLCFRPSAPAVSDLSSCDYMLCFDSKLALFGAFGGVVTSSGRHCPTPLPCPSWPAACAPSWDNIPFLSFVESSMTRVESYPTTGPEIPSVIGSLFCPSLQPLACTSHCSSPIFSLPPRRLGLTSGPPHQNRRTGTNGESGI